MPGLFGFARLGSHEPLDPTGTDRLLCAMADRLRHGKHEVVETFVDPARRFAVGRVRLPQLEAAPWPGRCALQQEPALLFVDGALYPAANGGGAAGTEDAAADRVRGMRGFFSVLVRDPNGGLLLATDRRASHPIFYAVVSDTLYFAPEVKALLAVPGLPRAIDGAAVGLLLGSGFLLGHQTLFSAVRRLPPATAIHIQEDGLRVEKYWRYTLSVDGDGTPIRDLEDELVRNFRRAVAQTLEEPERTVIFLSGGVDSRAIVGAAYEAVGGKGGRLRTITWSAGDALPGSDHAAAERIAAALGLRHRMARRRVDHYGRRLARSNYLIDGLSDIAAFHPSELATIEDLAEEGTCLVLRGDECIGWDRVHDAVDAALQNGVRSVSDQSEFCTVLREPARQAWGDSAADTLGAVLRSYGETPPENIRDYIYYEHRLPGYLQTSAYLKLTVLDHRAPVLDEAILALNARIPLRERRDKALYGRALARAFPELWALPFAAAHSLEDYELLLRTESPVRRFVETELRDERSAIWEYVDRTALARRLESARAGHRRAGWSAVIRERLRHRAKDTLRSLPPLEALIRPAYRRHVTRLDEMVLRLMALKQWIDVFVADDGSEAALARYIDRLERTYASTSAA